MNDQVSEYVCSFILLSCISPCVFVCKCVNGYVYVIIYLPYHKIL